MEWLPLPGPRDTQSTLRILDQDVARGVLRLAAWLGLLKKWPGVAFHKVLASWLESGPMAAVDFPIWWAERAAVIADAHGVALPATVSTGAVPFDHANRKADHWWRQGWRVYAWGSGGPPPAGDGCGSCPQVLFGRGDIVTDRCRVALFNSRKPRQVPPNEPWLAALREVLAELAVLPITVASSRGTLTYDLVSFFADFRGMPLNLVTTDAAGHGGLPPELPGETADHGDSLAGSGWQGSGRHGVLSCAIEELACQKSARMACRDRLLACLADLHVVLAIRNQGNLLQVLRAQQRHQPKLQWILELPPESAAARGNRMLAEEFPQWTRVISRSSADVGNNSADSGTSRLPGGEAGQGGSCRRRGHPSVAAPIQQGDCKGLMGREPEELMGELVGGLIITGAEPGGTFRDIAWDRYLYHYTRAWPGPWPGQTEAQYLASLVNGEPTCGHSALDTLLRILAEGRIRGSHRLVRGLQAVVSWTSRPPHELTEIRHWNRALGRWTFEPYGIAVNRRRLREFGVKPAIYGSTAVFERLRPEQRFRFQVGDATRAQWRREREWRLAGDLRLEPGIDVLVLVPDGAAAERLANEVNGWYRVVIV